ncbi:MAG: hypothetical protein J5645_06885 [Lachnospiraceae bacterium]|nr:hypothetical protein [Lachnospiraceae bacterium]
MKFRRYNRIVSLLVAVILLAGLTTALKGALAKPMKNRTDDIYNDARDNTPTPTPTKKPGKKDDVPEEKSYERYERIVVKDPDSAVFSFKSDQVAGASRLTGLRIDGEAERFWELGKEYKLNNYVFGTEEESATFRAICDDDRLYLFITVMDNTVNLSGDVPTRKDGVEIFLNENGRREPFYGEGDSHYFVLRDGTCVCGNGADGDRIDYAVAEIKGGYCIELSLAWSMPINRRSFEIGFDIRVNDSRTPGSRDGILAWSDTTLHTHEDLSKVGILLLR